MYAIFFATPHGWENIATINGCEAAYATYHKACELGELLCAEVALCDANTGEVVACLSDEDDE